MLPCQKAFQPAGPVSNCGRWSAPQARIHMLRSESPRSPGTSLAMPAAIGHVNAMVSTTYAPRHASDVRTAAELTRQLLLRFRCNRASPGYIALHLEGGHVGVDGFQLIGRRQENDAEIAVGGVGAEAGAEDDEDAGRAEEAEHVVPIRDARREGHLRHRVERAARRDAGHARD